MRPKKKIATVSLAGCFGCHMSVLDLDLELLELTELVEFDRSPLTDIKTFQHRVDIGLIEGAVCNDHNLHVLRDFRKNCDILISLGECAIMGGLPAMRNDIPLSECLTEAYLGVPTAVTGSTVLPHHPDLPKILDRVYPCHEVVKIDYFLAGCPPSAEVIALALKSLIKGDLKNGQLQIPQELIKYD